MVGVVTETEFPQPADGRIGGGHGASLPLGEHIAEGAEIRIGGRAFHHQAEVFFLVHAVAGIALGLQLGERRLEKFHPFGPGAIHIERAHESDGIEVGVEGRRRAPREMLDPGPQLLGAARAIHCLAEAVVIELAAGELL